MQPSEYEIQREVEALRDIRRRSVAPGALTIDPDLPNQSSPPSPGVAYWSGSDIPSLLEEDSSSSSHEDDSTSSHAPNNPADDPFHLFWVPADVHPEIAPAEFRAFLKEHARAPGTDGSASPQRSNSLSSNYSGLGRKKSMLSRQYRPSENDGVEKEETVKRRGSMRTSNMGPQLTISDLQRLEELAEEASESADSSKLRNVLRRSLSLNLSPSAILDDMPEMGDEADSPIIVPPPGQILRRAARTKIRKPGLPGDGGGHRFNSSRRPTRAGTTPAAPASDQRSSSDLSSSDHGDSVESLKPNRTRTFSNESSEGGLSEEALSIFDAYARDDEPETGSTPVLITSPPSLPSTPAEPFHQTPPPPSAVEPPRVVPPEPANIIHQPQPQRLLMPQTPGPQPSRTPSPSEEGGSPSSSIGPSRSPDPTSPTPSQAYRKDNKDKKGGLFGKWGSDKGGKKTGKEREREREEDKGSGFFGSLFGSKKKQDDHPSVPLGMGATSGREAAAALLGASKSSKQYQPPPSPSNVGAANNYARYPIHVERAIYRLSHIKLANPRRPLYEQVLISNLMFWYLGVINKTTPAAGSPAKDSSGEANKANGTANGGAEKEQKEKEQKEREERARAEKEKQEKEQKEAEQKKKESTRRGTLNKANQPGNNGRRAAEMPVKGPQYEMQHRVMEQEYGGGYGQPPMPSGHGPSPHSGRGSSNPPGGGGGGGQHGRMKLVPQQQPQSQAPLPLSQQPMYSSHSSQQMPGPQQQQQQIDPYSSSAEAYYYNEPVQYAPSGNAGAHKLPPGAMAPVINMRSPTGTNPGQGHPMTSGPGSAGGPRRSRSPPGQSPVNLLNSPQSPPNVKPADLLPNRFYQQPPAQQSQPQQQQDVFYQQPSTGRPTRSMSATAAPPQPSVNGGGAKLRKGVSAHATAPSPPNGRPRTAEGPVSRHAVEDSEDVPLAVWQRQQRR